MEGAKTPVCTGSLVVGKGSDLGNRSLATVIGFRNVTSHFSGRDEA